MCYCVGDKLGFKGATVNLINQIESEGIASWSTFNVAETIQLVCPPDKIDYMIHNALVGLRRYKRKGWTDKIYNTQLELTNLKSIREAYVDAEILPPLKDE